MFYIERARPDIFEGTKSVAIFIWQDPWREGWSHVTMMSSP